jgi:GxxExxY protein
MLLDDATCGLTYRINGCAIKVHRRYGPGLLEHAYQMPLVSELEACGFVVECEKPLPLIYHDKQLPCSYRLDLLVEETVIVEIKAVEQLLPVHIAQVKTYLKMTGLKVGLLINFNVPILRHGIRRILHPDLERSAVTQSDEPEEQSKVRKDPMPFE